MSWVLVVLLIVFNILLVANYVQAVRMIRRIALQNSLLSISLLENDILTEEDAKPNLKIVENPPPTEEE